MEYSVTLVSCFKVIGGDLALFPFSVTLNLYH